MNGNKELPTLIVGGKYTEAHVFTDDVEPTALSQIETVANHPAFKNASIRIMPDVHAGAGCVIGFTCRMEDGVVPNLVGVDIGCGVLAVRLGYRDVDFAKLDNVIRTKVPYGFNVHPKPQYSMLVHDVRKACNLIEEPHRLLYHLQSTGTLGGGNHFIEVGEEEDGIRWLFIHSGSRNFGHSIASYYQRMAVSKDRYGNPDLAPLYGMDMEEYLLCQGIAKRFASHNRWQMATTILASMGWPPVEELVRFDTIHNYMDNDGLIRKGAVSAKEGENFVVPLNMRDGTLLCVGKGNVEWNNSAPHGAGRCLSRSKAKKQLNVADFEKQMEGVWTSCVSESTLDESPSAYKDGGKVESLIGPTASIVGKAMPIYNFKA